MCKQMKWRWFIALVGIAFIGEFFFGSLSQSTTSEMIIRWDTEADEDDDLVVTFWEEGVDGRTKLLDNWTGKNLKIITPDGDHLKVHGREISVMIEAAKK